MARSARGSISLHETWCLHRAYGARGYVAEIFVYFLHPRVDPISVIGRSDDGSLTSDNAISRWCLAMEEAMARSGRTNPSQEQLKTRLEKAGFVDVQSFTVNDPIGPWAKAKYGSLDSHGAMLQQFSCPAKKAYQAV
jgi:hypothetical protein